MEMAYVSLKADLKPRLAVKGRVAWILMTAREHCIPWQVQECHKRNEYPGLQSLV